MAPLGASSPNPEARFAGLDRGPARRCLGKSRGSMPAATLDGPVRGVRSQAAKLAPQMVRCCFQAQAQVPVFADGSGIESPDLPARELGGGGPALR